MKRLWRPIHRFLFSLSGRIALILTIGVPCAVFVGALAAKQVGQYDAQRIRTERAIASAIDVATRVERDPRAARQRLASGGLAGAHLLQGAPPADFRGDRDASGQVASRAAARLLPELAQVATSVCVANDPFWRIPRAAGFTVSPDPDCWLLALGPPAQRLYVTIDLPPFRMPPSLITGTTFFGAIIAVSALLSALVAGLATRPLRRLANASQAFARSIDAEPVRESGPNDVRQALSTFNVMQDRVRGGLRERTRLLAAISHDLQTPLTRLRLRLEQVEDVALRERLVADLSQTLAMVKRGLDLARSGESAEAWSSVDIDSLLSSMAEDAAEFGQPVRFVRGCGRTVRAKPDALTRCLSNLIDNAVKYAGGAEISCRSHAGEVVIMVRDNGPGIPEAMLERIFEPFVRSEQHGGERAEGTGIGLTIARAQAAAIGGELTLANRPRGGLIAKLKLSQA